MIRDRTDDDLEPLRLVVRRCHEQDGYPIWLPNGDVLRFLTRPSSVAAWVVERDQSVVGHVALNSASSVPATELAQATLNDRPPIFVARLLVDPDFRYLGLGRELLDHAEQAAQALGRTPFLDVVDLPGARPAIDLYHRAGWTEIGRVPFAALDGAEEIVFRGCR